MKTEVVSISKAIDAVLEIIRQSGVSEDTLSRTRRIYEKLNLFYSENGESICNHKLNLNFMMPIEEKRKAKSINNVSYSRFRRAITALEDYTATGKVQIKYSYGSRYLWKLSAEYESLLKCFTSSLNMAESSRRTCVSIVRNAFHYLESQGIRHASEITQNDLRKYITENAKNFNSRMSNFILAIRKLAAYLRTFHGVDVSEDVVALKVRRGRRRVFPAFTHEEMLEILRQPDLNTRLGKRDYAILMLASYTGLRTIDIASLKLGDINWLEKTVAVVQQKTKIANNLPLGQHTLLAIADYILRARPAVSSEHIFITEIAPYRKLSGFSSVRNVVGKYLRQAGIHKTAWDGKGFHAIRRRLGLDLLEASMPIEMISQILGHVDTNSAKHYLPIHVDMMRLCALGVDDIPVTGGVYS